MLEKRFQVIVVGIQAFWPLARCPIDLGRAHAWLDRADNARRDLVLKVEDVVHGSVVPLSPHVCARGSIDELSGDADAGACLPYAALEHITNAEAACDLAYVEVEALELEGGRTRRHEEPAQP